MVAKYLTICVTCHVALLGDMDIPDDVYKELEDAYYRGDDIYDKRRYPHAYEWLTNNIDGRGGIDFEYNIEDIGSQEVSE